MRRMRIVNCPHCNKPINPASLLAAMGKGVRKQFSAAERKRRAQRLAIARQKRHAKPANDGTERQEERRQ